VVCERKNAIANCCAIARTYPLFSAKTSQNDASKTRFVSVSFYFVDGETTWPTEQELKCYNVFAQSVRLSAKIVDMPCADMNTDSFLNVRYIP
jgi:probable aminopeptidase NPEPL1